MLCLDAQNGNLIWNRNIVHEHDVRPPSWALSSSIVVYNDTLLVNVNSAGLCLDPSDGSRIWSSGTSYAGYASPVLARIDGQMQALFFSWNGVSGVDPADGTRIWHHGWETANDVNAADPVVFGNRVFISTGYGTGCTVFEVNGGTTSTVWRGHTFASHFSSFVLHDGYIYGNDGSAGAGRSQFKCIDPDTGETQWSATAAGMGSLIATDRHLVLFSERGHVVIAELTPEAYRPLAEFDAERGVYWTAPVLCGNRLFVRETYGMLSCYQFEG
jgi:outer membrane protein assembly factor BamB